MDWKRHASSIAILAGFLGLTTATQQRRSEFDATPSPPIPVAPVVATPKDLDVDAAIKALGCTGKHTDACRILEEFKTATTPTDFPKTGQDLWVGESFPLKGAAGVDREPNFLQLQPGAIANATIPTSALLDVQGSMRSLIPDNATEKADSDAVLDALRHKRPVPKGSKAIDYMRTSPPKSGFRTMLRAGTSVGMLVDRAYTYSYYRVSGDRLLVVEYDSGAPLTHMTGGPSAEAWCTELWKVP
jgi:hypothetical protein